MPRTNYSSLMGKKISIIINPKAANKKWKRRRLLQKHLKRNFPVQVIDNHENKAFTIDIAKRLSLDHDIIVAAGGDGTVADVIQGIVESERVKDITLGIIPLGSGNAFRKSLGIPKSAKKSLKLISTGKPKEIDLIDIEGTVSAFASIGATAQVTMEKLQYRIPGLLGHVLASRIMPKISRREQEIELIDGVEDSGRHFDHKILKLRVFDCVIGKTNHFGYSWKVAPKAKVDDGFIDITLFEMSGLKYLLFFPSIYFGLFQRTQKHFKAKKIIIQGKNLPVQYNGEFLGLRDKIEIKILPRVIKVMCPEKKE